MARTKHPPRRVRHVRFCDWTEWPLIEARAAAEGIDPSSYLREAALREARRELARTPGELQPVG